MDFDATSLYPSAMWEDESVYPKIENGYPFTVNMNDELVGKFSRKNFNQGSAFLKLKYSNPPETLYQNLPVKERVQKIETNRMKNEYIVDTLTSVDNKEFIRIGGKIIQILRRCHL